MTKNHNCGYDYDRGGIVEVSIENKIEEIKASNVQMTLQKIHSINTKLSKAEDITSNLEDLCLKNSITNISNQIEVLSCKYN